MRRFGSDSPNSPSSRGYLANPAPLAWVGLIMIGSGLLLMDPGRRATAGLVHAVPAEAGSIHPSSLGNRCESCHQFEKGFSHPVGVRPSMTVPAHLPLDNGAMSCTTCHVQQEHSRAGLGPMLRDASGPSLCAQCHTGSSGKDMHASRMNRAHFGLTTSRSSMGSTPHAATLGHLDAESQECMSCHDGTTASDAGSHALQGSFGVRGSKDHPIGVPYPSRRGKGHESPMVDLSRLDRRVRLFDQALGCGSCHSPYSPHKDQLVIPNVRSQLCLTCHEQ